MLALLLTAATIATAVGIYAHRRPEEKRPSSHNDAEALLERLPSMSDAELLALIPKLAKCRPLSPWPRHEWEQAFRDPDAMFRAREEIWERFERQPQPSPVIVDWYHGSRLRIHMGNELSRGLFVLGAFDANEFAWLDEYLKPGMVFVDAGAHEGLYSLFAALRTGPNGRVLAIEPSARECAAWQANLELNSRHATLVPCALAAADGEAALLVAQDHRSGHNTLGAFTWEGVHAASRRIVPARSLDSLAAEYALDRIDVLKIDIEGAETQALRGGARVFLELRPTVIIEVSGRSLEAQGSSRAELLAVLEEYGYALHAFDYETGLLVPGADNQGGDNLVAIPLAASR